MKLGVVLPQTEIGADPIALRDFAQTVEELGYSHLLAFEHVLGVDPSNRPGWDGHYTHEHQFHEPFVLFGYLAGLTSRLEFATNVMVVPQRQTALVAKQAAELDVLSGGRLRLGVGVGWNAVEFAALGGDFSTRGARCEEQIPLLRAFWTEESVTFDGRWDHIDGLGIRPLPVQRPIPIWLGGASEATLDRVGRLADGWFPMQFAPENLARNVARLHAGARGAGRDPADIGIEPMFWPHSTDEAVWRAQLEDWQQTDHLTHLSFVTLEAGLTGAAEHLAAVRRFKEIADSLGL